MYIDVSYSAQPALRHTDQVQQYCDGVKRIIDVVIVLGLGPIWGPLVAFLWGLVRLHGDTGFLHIPDLAATVYHFNAGKYAPWAGCRPAIGPLSTNRRHGHQRMAHVTQTQP